MVECVVEFEYVAQEEDELTIRPGEIISNVQKQDGGWWEGEVNGRKGMFPDNFVKEIKQEAKKAAPESNHRTSVKKVSAGGGHVAELANRLGKEGAIRIGPPAPGAPGPLKREVSQVKRQQRVKVTFSYNPENNDELRLEVGDVVTVTKQEEEGWWEGILKGKTGMFPSNFVESFDEDGGGPGEASGDEVNTPEIEIHGKKIKGVGLGNIFSAGPIKLRSTGSKDHPSAVKREPPPPKKEPIANEHEKRDSLKRNAAPSEPPPSLPPKDQPTVKPSENKSGYAVPYEEAHADKEASDSDDGRGYSPGGIVLEDGVMVKSKKCTPPSSDFSLPELDIASPESSCSIDLCKVGAISSASFSSSGPCSARSENPSDEVPFELGALSQTRHTPPPRFTQFNFRKRRSRGTPKNSPNLSLLAIKTGNQKSQKNEIPPKKVAKLVGTSCSVEDQAVMTEECKTLEMKTVESQTDAQYVESDTVKNVRPQRVVIKAFIRSRSEPCLSTAKKSVSFVTKDNYISDGEEDDNNVQISEGAKKRMSRAKRRFPGNSLIDASKITDSLKLLRVRLGLDADTVHTEGASHLVELDTSVDVKAKTKTLSSIKNNFIRRIVSSPVRGDNVKNSKVTALSNVNIGDTGIPVTEDNCSTTALRGSPLFTRSSSILNVECSGKDVSKSFIAPVGALVDDLKDNNDPPSTKIKSTQGTHPVYKRPFFTFNLGRKKSLKVKIQEPGKFEELPKEIEHSELKPETSYFQTLDNLGKMPPTIKNIGTKYKLFSKRQPSVTPDKVEKVETEGNLGDLTNSRKDSHLFLTSFQDVQQRDEGKYKEPENKARIQNEEGSVQMATPYEEPVVALAPFDGGVYAPNEGDQNKSLIKRTKKSTNIAIAQDAVVDVRKANERKSSANKPLKKTNSITQRFKRIWGSREKVTKGCEEDAGKGKGNSQGRREKLLTTSDTTTLQATSNSEFNAQNRILATKSEGALVNQTSAESASSDEGDKENIAEVGCPENINQNSVSMDAIFRLQNLVHSFTQSESDVAPEVTCFPGPVMSEKSCELVSATSGSMMAEPCLQNEDANLEYPVTTYKSNSRLMDVETTHGQQGREPRRIVPTRIAHQVESMQTEYQGEANSSEMEHLVNPVVMHCQIKGEKNKVFRPYGGFLEAINISEKNDREQINNSFNGPDFLTRRNKFDSIEMDMSGYCNNEKLKDFKNQENSTRSLKWSRWNSAPPGSRLHNARNSSGFPRHNTSLVVPNDSSLDKWDMMKLILEETGTVFRPSAQFMSIHTEKASLSMKIEKRVRRPFDYDESFSNESSCDTDSADEATGMETGDFEPENNVHSSSSDGSFDPIIRSFYASDDDLYGSAPVSSPCHQYNQLQQGISMSSLNDSLSQLEAIDRGGSGEKRKKCEVGTPTKDDNHSRKVRLESPESDDEGPPRARRVLESSKK